MTDHASHKPEGAEHDASREAASRPLPPPALRALEEAAARREAYQAKEDAMPKELGGRRKGREPARYGDWELKGLAVDF